MAIEFRRWNGTGDPHDPKVGTPMSATSDSIYALLRGKVVSGTGGWTAGTESVQIFFSDGSGLWFLTEHGRPRILFQDKP